MLIGYVSMTWVGYTYVLCGMVVLQCLVVSKCGGKRKECWIHESGHCFNVAGTYLVHVVYYLNICGSVPN